MMRDGFVLIMALAMWAVSRAGAASARGTELPGPDELPSIKQLPDPFLLADGSRVKSPEDWPRRRAELLELVQAYEYGHVPPKPEKVTAEETPTYVPPLPDGSDPTKPAAPRPENLPAGTTHKSLLLKMGPEGKTVQTHVILTLPPGGGRRPVIVRGDLCWGRVTPEIEAEIVKRGYILAEFDRTEIVPDKKGPREGFLYAAYPDHDFGAAAAWAWGFQRVVDYLLTRDDVDPRQVVITGHSRGGKAALCAGATDERIALTVPNGSGCGGAGCYRFQAPKSEELGAILKNFPYWFSPRLPSFVGKVDRLPIDQHEVKALIAPRALLTTEATGDLWANPAGTQQSHAGAKVVFDYLGAGEKIGLHYREGKHEQNADDWGALLDFADRLFGRGKNDTDFKPHPYPTDPPAFAWTAPAKQ